MRLPVCAALAIITLVTGLPPLQAGKLTLEYNLDRRVIHACNLIVPGGYSNRNPYLFIALQRSPLKPSGWEFDNPLAVPYVQDRPGTAVDMWDQWQNAGHAPDAGSGPGYWGNRGMAVGSPLNKSWPQYWEVYYDGYTAQRLRDYDLIYVACDTINLSASLRQSLIEAVENGAILWIDSGGGYNTTITNLMPPRIAADGSGNYIPFTFVPQPADVKFRRQDAIWNAERNSDLFRTPHTITPGERYALGDLPEAWTPCDGNYISVPTSPRPDQELVPILYTRDTVSGTSYPTIAVCQYGAGRIVVTANGVGDDAEEWLLQGMTGPDAYQAPDVKLAYNIVAWGTSWTGGRQSSINTGYTTASALPPLDIAWQFPHRDANPASQVIGPVVAAPVVSHGRVFAVSLISDAYAGGTATPALLMCFDADPSRDLDGDGNPDDAADLDTDGNPDPAFFDYRYGLPYDLVWARPLNSLSLGATSSATPRWAGVAACNLPDGTFAVLCAFVSQTGDSPNGFVAAVNGETGQLLWTFAATPFSSRAEVRDISTPVAHRGWVYFVCSEFDNSLDGDPSTASADDTYGRAWCIDLQTGGGSVAAPPWFTDYGVWSFPDPDVDDDGVTAPGDTDEVERPGLLPPFAEPLWIAGIFPQEGSTGRPRQLPPDPGVMPAVTTRTRNADDRTEAVMIVGSPVSMRYEASSDRTKIARGDLSAPFDQIGGNERRGGEDIALVPTPGRSVGGSMQWFLNRSYYRLFMPDPLNAPGDITEIARHDDNTKSITGGWQLEGSPSQVVILDPDKARYLIACKLGGPGSTTNPTAQMSGLYVDVTLATPPPPPSTHPVLRWLRGQVPWHNEYPPEERRIAPAALRTEKLFAVTTVPDPLPGPSPITPPGRTGRIVSQDLRIGAREWQYDPGTVAPQLLGVTDPLARAKSAPAVAHETVVSAVSLQPRDPASGSRSVATVVGTRTSPLLTISLCAKPSVPNHWRIARDVPNPVDPDDTHRKPVTVRLLRNNGVVDESYYEIGYDEATITFHWETAWNVTAQLPGGGTWAGHIYGEPLLIRWRYHDDKGTPDDMSDDTYGWSDDNPDMDELYVVPPLERFVYVEGFIKLKYYPVEYSSIGITTIEGTPVAGWQQGEALVPIDWNNDGTPDAQLLPHGWVDLRNAFLDMNGNGSYDAGTDRALPPGVVLRVSYTGFTNEWGRVAVPNAALNAPEELHQAPLGFGPSASATSMAGSTIHVGTEGYAVGDVTGDGIADFGTAPGARSPSETLLSLVWEPASNMVRGWLCAPADLGNYRTNPLQIAACTGSPALDTDAVFVGSRVMNDVSVGQSVGFVSRLSTRRTLIVDASRVIECAGQDVNWELTATQSWEYGQANVDRPVQLPLNHPAKVTALGGGNFLIVDTGNNRVVEVDSSGNVLWPLGEAYSAPTGDPAAPIVNWYSSSLNADLHLRRPCDAQRYSSVYDINGDGAVEQVIHTLIADSGNDRVLHVRSWWEWDSGDGRWEQRHRVQRVTPEYLQDPSDVTRRVKAHYTHVAGIPHVDPNFSNPATANLVGYLCAAANLKEIVVMGFYQESPGGPIQFAPNPPADSYLPGATGPTSPKWSVWAWLYDDDPGDANIKSNDPLLFAGLKHMGLQRVADVLYLEIACGQYQGRQSKLTGRPPYADLVGPAALEFRVSYNPTNPGLIPASPGGVSDPDRPIWDFTQTDYNDPTGVYPAPGLAHFAFFRLPLPNGTTYYKRFLPTCVTFLPTGRRLIVNDSGLIERLTKQAIRRTGLVCSSEVFEVETSGDGDDDPTNDGHDIDSRRLIPDPYGGEWQDPLVAPTYAERVSQ
jgi:hypothetical protein